MTEQEMFERMENRDKDPNGAIDETLSFYDYYDKVSAIRWLEDSVLNRMVTMFDTENSLPDSIPEKELFKIVMRRGKGCVSDVRDTLVVNKCSYIPPLDMYRHGTKLRVVNPWGMNVPGKPWEETASTTLNKDYTIGVDCVKLVNDPLEIGVLPIIWKYGVFLTELELSYLNFLISLRAPFALIADDKNAKEAADEWLQGLRDGNLASIMSNAISKNLEGVHTTPFSSMQAGALTQFIEGEQYTKAMLWNEFGIDMNYNMKRERLNDGEVEQNQGILRTLCDSMYEEYARGFDEVNKMFGTNWTIKFGGQWSKYNPNMATDGDGIITNTEEPDNGEEDELTGDNVEENRGETENGGLNETEQETEENVQSDAEQTDKQDDEEDKGGNSVETETLADIDDIKEIVEDIKEIVEAVAEVKTEEKEDAETEEENNDIEGDAEPEN